MYEHFVLDCFSVHQCSWPLPKGGMYYFSALSTRCGHVTCFGNDIGQEWKSFWLKIIWTSSQLAWFFLSLCHGNEQCLGLRALCLPQSCSDHNVMQTQTVGVLDTHSQREINPCSCTPLGFRVCFSQQHNIHCLDSYTSFIKQTNTKKKNFQSS